MKGRSCCRRLRVQPLTQLTDSEREVPWFQSLLLLPKEAEICTDTLIEALVIFATERFFINGTMITSNPEIQRNEFPGQEKTRRSCEWILAKERGWPEKWSDSSCMTFWKMKYRVGSFKKNCPELRWGGWTDGAQSVGEQYCCYPWWATMHLPRATECETPRNSPGMSCQHLLIVTM